MSKRFLPEIEKGNQVSAFVRAKHTLKKATKLNLSDTSVKLLELEYLYGQDCARHSIEQRAPMMTGFAASVTALSVAIVLALGYFGISKISALIAIVAFLTIAIISVIFMRSFYLLRSDWGDYLVQMATIKMSFLQMETKLYRDSMLKRSLFHDPRSPVERFGRANLWHTSFLICGIVLALSSFIAGYIYFQLWAFPDVAVDISIANQNKTLAVGTRDYWEVHIVRYFGSDVLEVLAFILVAAIVLGEILWYSLFYWKEKKLGRYMTSKQVEEWLKAERKRTKNTSQRSLMRARSTSRRSRLS